MKRVLFACIENSNRSQMAEAFARIHGIDLIEAVSAGSRASGVVNPRAIESMSRRGYDLSTHRSKTLDEVTGPFDYVITMGCGEECPFVASTMREDWALPDPGKMGSADFDEVRNEIERRVIGLIERIRKTPD